LAQIYLRDESQLTYIFLQYKPTGQQNVGCLIQRSISSEDRKHQKGTNPWK